MLRVPCKGGTIAHLSGTQVPSAKLPWTVTNRHLFIGGPRCAGMLATARYSFCTPRNVETLSALKFPEVVTINPDRAAAPGWRAASTPRPADGMA